MKQSALLTLAFCTFVSAGFAQYSLTVESHLQSTPLWGRPIASWTCRIQPTWSARYTETTTERWPSTLLKACTTVSSMRLGMRLASPFVLSVIRWRRPYATIGLDGPAPTGIVGAADPVWIDQPLSHFSPQTVSPLHHMEIGSTWFMTVPATEPQSDDLRVLVCSATTVPYRVN